MKPNQSAWALLIALALHGLLLILIWSTARNPSQEIPIHHEKRFGILVSEELELTEETASPSTFPADMHQPDKQEAKKRPTARANPQNQAPVIELKHLSEADRESLPFSVLHHYGEEFFNLSAGEQHFIIDNLQKIRKINEVVGTRLLRDRSDVDPMDNNVVEFILNPDGSIRDLALEKNRIGTPLDELTLQTINLAHPKYPKPYQPTHIRIRVYIIVK